LGGIAAFELVHFVGDGEVEKIPQLKANHVIPMGRWKSPFGTNGIHTTAALFESYAGWAVPGGITFVANFPMEASSLYQCG
jgi:hypothetical protein